MNRHSHIDTSTGKSSIQTYRKVIEQTIFGMYFIGILSLGSCCRKHHSNENDETVNIVFHTYLLDLISRLVSDRLMGWKPYR